MKVIIVNLFSDLHCYNSFFNIQIPTITHLKPKPSYNKELQRVRPTFALAEARTYEEIEAALATIEKFQKPWHLT